MDPLQKRLLGWGGIVLMVILGLFLLVKTNREMNTATNTNTVSFSGEGKVLAKPDVAIIDLAIVTDAASSKAAQDANSKKSQAVTNFLKKQDIDEKDIKTTGYNIYPQYDYTDGRSVLRGYQVNETLQVKVRDLTKTDTILDGVVTAGANQVNSLQMTIDKPEELRDQARKEAIKDAKEKAGVLEDQLGISLGHIISFSEGGNGIVMPMYSLKADSARGMGGGGGPAISAGENEIVVNVTLTYQIK